MKLFSEPLCLYGHTCRLVMREKDAESDFHFFTKDHPADELSEINPYGESPTLVDRDLVLYNVIVINEYLDERLPHPPLMPIDPVGRGRARLLIYRLHRDWLDNVQAHMVNSQKFDQKHRLELADSLSAMSTIFSNQDYILGDEMTLADCYVAPLLWRLSLLGIDLQKQGVRLEEYSERLFSRESFQQSLSDEERELRR